MHAWTDNFQWGIKKLENLKTIILNFYRFHDRKDINCYRVEFILKKAIKKYFKMILDFLQKHRVHFFLNARQTNLSYKKANNNHWKCIKLAFWKLWRLDYRAQFLREIVAKFSCMLRANSKFTVHQGHLSPQKGAQFILKCFYSWVEAKRSRGVINRTQIVASRYFVWMTTYMIHGFVHLTGFVMHIILSYWCVCCA